MDLRSSLFGKKKFNVKILVVGVLSFGLLSIVAAVLLTFYW